MTPVRPAALLPLTLALVLTGVPAPRAQEGPPPPAAVSDGWQALDEALTELELALSQQVDPTLWSDVRITVEGALQAVGRAREQGAPPHVCEAARTTLVAVQRRQDELERQAFAESEEQRAWDMTTLASVTEALQFAEGHLPATSFLLAETLFLMEADGAAQKALSRGLVLWPADERLHETVSVWKDVLPQPEVLAQLLLERAGRLGSASAAASGLGLETAAQLQMNLARRRYEQALASGDQLGFQAAGEGFDEAARTLLRSLSMPTRMSADAVDAMRGDALVNAAYSHLGQAKLIWVDDPDEAERAPAAMAAAEEALVAALRLDPDHVPYQDAVLFVGQEWMDKGQSEAPRVGDMDDARNFYRRMAERFDDPDWWNNHAFLSREMGTAMEMHGESAMAQELFEESFASYERTIAGSPDNARYVNDTGLMLFYHLHRDLERAEALFLRAWELGEAVCANPFVDEAVYDENFVAYTDAMLNLARLYEQQGRLEEAVAVARELVSLAPDRMDATQSLRQIERALGEDS